MTEPAVPAPTEGGAAPPEAAPGDRARIGVIGPLLIALGIATALGYAERLWWVFDIIGQFRAHALAAALLLGLYAGVGRAWRWVAVSAALVVANAVPMASLFVGEAAQGPATLTVVSLNVELGGHRGRVLNWLDTVDADLVALQEVDAGWLAALAATGARWPHRVGRPRDNFLGLALLSRWPVTAQRVLHPGADPADEVLWARVETPGGPVEVWVAHPLPPMSAAFWARRRALIEGLAAEVAQGGPRRVVLGDFNATPWAAALAPLRDSGLRQGRAGRGYQGTWPAGWPMLAVPIDHVFVHGFDVVGHRIGPEVGSDHRPVIVELAAPALAPPGGAR